MSKRTWFSAKLRFVIMIENLGGKTLNDCVFVFKSEDFETAFIKAISIGEHNEAQYKNMDGECVVWKFMEVISLDIIGREMLDGAEVYSEPIHLNEKDILPFDSVFNPKASRPIQTI